jgi:hypothetical protein
VVLIKYYFSARALILKEQHRKVTRAPNSLLIYALRVVKLHIRTVSAILVWVAIALLFLNVYLNSEGLFLLSIAIVIIAVLTYFIPLLKKKSAR